MRVSTMNSSGTKLSAEGREQVLRQRLLQWYRAQARDLPWRESRDPYRVWLSEIMMQQTRVAAVIAHYHEFLRRFPTVEKLAAAREASVLAAWSGLGYYRRGGIQHAAAEGGGGGRGGGMARVAGHWPLHGGGDCQHCLRRTGGGGRWECGAGTAAAVGKVVGRRG